VVIVRGPWSVGVVGLVAARLAEDHGRPAVVGADLGPTIRASCRSGPGVDLAATLERCGDLLVRHGGHAGAAGFEIRPEHWAAFNDRFSAAVAAVAPEVVGPSIEADLAIPARLVDYTLARDVARLEPYGPGNPDPLFIVVGLTVGRIRSANGGHTQLVLRRDIDVLDGIAFGRDDLVGSVAEGDRVDVVARIVSRRFGGIESLQLDVRDVAPSGWFEVPRRSPTEEPAPGPAGLAGPAVSGALR
jgi:single-stranded-DNA-specific exonuclease